MSKYTVVVKETWLVGYTVEAPNKKEALKLYGADGSEAWTEGQRFIVEDIYEQEVVND